MLLDRTGTGSQIPETHVRSRPIGWGALLRSLTLGVAAPHPTFWAATSGLLALDAIWLSIRGIRLDTQGVLIAGSTVVGLLTTAAVLGPIKSEPKLRAMALSAASLIAFTGAVAVFHYLTATLALPFADRWLAAAERGLGFDWTAYVALLAAHPSLSRWLALAYHSSGPQIGLVVIALGATSRLGRLWTFVRLYAVLLSSVILISALVPAVGPYAHYQPPVVPAASIDTIGALWHLDPLIALRNGTLRVIVLSDIRGLAVFPSFHVCLAVITAWALAPVPLLGPLSWLLNLAVVVSAVGSGGHYLPDVLAGGVLATLALLCRSGTRHLVSLRQLRALRRERQVRSLQGSGTTEAGCRGVLSDTAA